MLVEAPTTCPVRFGATIARAPVSGTTRDLAGRDGGRQVARADGLIIPDADHAAVGAGDRDRRAGRTSSAEPSVAKPARRGGARPPAHRSGARLPNAEARGSERGAAHAASADRARGPSRVAGPEQEEDAIRAVEDCAPLRPSRSASSRDAEGALRQLAASQDPPRPWRARAVHGREQRCGGARGFHRPEGRVASVSTSASHRASASRRSRSAKDRVDGAAGELPRAVPLRGSVGARQHFTFGGDLRLLPWDMFGHHRRGRCGASAPCSTWRLGTSTSGALVRGVALTPGPAAPSSVS